MQTSSGFCPIETWNLALGVAGPQIDATAARVAVCIGMSQQLRGLDCCNTSSNMLGLTNRVFRGQSSRSFPGEQLTDRQLEALKEGQPRQSRPLL